MRRSRPLRSWAVYFQRLLSRRAMRMAYRSAASRLRYDCVGMKPSIECVLYMGVFFNGWI
jgi:hypothetical protein